MTSLFRVWLCFLTLFCLKLTESLSVNSEETIVTKGKDDVLKTEFIDYKTPEVSPEFVYLYESFDDVQQFKRNWIKSESTKKDSTEYRYNGTWDLVVTHHRIRGDYGLRMKNKSRLHAIARKMDRVFHFKDEDLIVQYDVQYRNGLDCGGSYLKLLTHPSGNLSRLSDATPYSIMFGPDKCGGDHKLHFIFTHKNPKTGKLREIHWAQSHKVNQLSDAVNDLKWHIFRLHLRPDNSFNIHMDKRLVASGNLLEAFSPAVNAEKEIEVDQEKPEDWDDREFIPDPESVKPSDWVDGPEKIPDLEARKPDDWLDEEPLEIPDPQAEEPENWNHDLNGFWEAPLIPNPICDRVSGCGQWSPPLKNNPNYRGKWVPKMIPNPNYQGKWMPKKVANPDYYEDLHPFRMQAIDSVAFELWTLNEAIVFDNVLITDSVDVADTIERLSYQIKRDLNDVETDSWFKNLIKNTNRKPWLWAVYIVVIAVPLILFIGFCCVSPNSSPDQMAADCCKKRPQHPFNYDLNYSPASLNQYSQEDLDSFEKFADDNMMQHSESISKKYRASCSYSKRCSKINDDTATLESFRPKVLSNIMEKFDELEDNICESEKAVDDEDYEIDDHPGDKFYDQSDETPSNAEAINSLPDGKAFETEMCLLMLKENGKDPSNLLASSESKVVNDEDSNLGAEIDEEEMEKLIPGKNVRRRRRNQNNKIKNAKNKARKSRTRN